MRRSGSLRARFLLAVRAEKAQLLQKTLERDLPAAGPHADARPTPSPCHEFAGNGGRCSFLSRANCCRWAAGRLVDERAFAPLDFEEIKAGDDGVTAWRRADRAHPQPPPDRQHPDHRPAKVHEASPSNLHRHGGAFRPTHLLPVPQRRGKKSTTTYQREQARLPAAGGYQPAHFFEGAARGGL